MSNDARHTYESWFAPSSGWVAMHESRLKQARLPWVKTLEQFDYDFQPSIDRKVARELSGPGFVDRAENVVLPGPPGVGKPHLAIALAVKAAEAGHRVMFMGFDKLMITLKKARLENRLERQMRLLAYPTLLVLYEISHLPMDQDDTGLQQELLRLGGDLR